MQKSIWNADLGNGCYRNPILYADYSDPDAIRVGEDYFMIASSFSNAPGLPLLHSKDLVNWRVVNYILPKVPEERYDKPVHGCGVWAPSLRYHEGTYFACFPMPDEGIYMCTAKDPFGAWSKPVNIRPAAGWIDPCPFWDEDGRAYLVAGVAKSRIGYKSVLHMVEMQPDGMGLIGEEVKIFDGNENDQNTIEGPKMYKRNGWYYIFAPAGGVKTGWQTVLRSRNVFGPYEYKVVMRQGDSLVNGPHQGAWVDTVTGEDWFLHFQDVNAAGRIIHLQPMSWKEDWPVIGIAKAGNDYGEPVEEYRKPDVGNVHQEICEPAASDDFSSPSLGMQWQWNANPKDDWYELTGGKLRLFAVSTPQDMVYGNVPNLLLQKWPAPEFSCVTKLKLQNLQEGDTAGVISMGMEYGLLEIKREKEELVLGFVKGVQHFANNVEDSTDETVTLLARLKAQDTAQLYVKYDVKKTGEQGFAPETVSICYSLDGAEYVTAGSMQAVPGRWVGVKNGVFCIRRAAGSGGFLTVESVQYERHFARTYSNPVQRGFFPDPSVVRVGEDYYMVNSTFQYFPAIAISHSRDMVHWELIGHAITNPDDLDLQDIRDSHGIWAPDISYDNGKFIIMATLRLNADGKRNNNVMRRQLVMTSERPEGPYSRPACLEVDSIDPSHFVDDDGKHYMVISPGINLVPLSDDCTRVVGDVIPVWQGTGERCPEGPHILRHGEYYYAILAEGGTGYGHGINVGRSRNLFGPYEASPYNPLMRQTDPQAPIQRTGHGKLIETHNGDWWVYYLMGRPNQGHYTTIGRETGMDPVTWLPDGWFVINDRKGPSLTQIAPDLPECSYPKWSRDDFDREILDVHWEFVRNPAPGSYSLTQRPGYFRIWTRDGQLNEIRAKNTLLRREQELCYEACTKVEFYPSKNGEQAGLTCYYSTATYARFCICYEEGRKLQLVINRNHGEELMAEVCDIREQAVYLKVVVEHLTRTFYYSYDGTEWIEAGVLKDCIYLCDEGVPDDPKRHTGTLVGIYANNGGCGSRIPADFDFFEYKD